MSIESIETYLKKKKKPIYEGQKYQFQVLSSETIEIRDCNTDEFIAKITNSLPALKDAIKHMENM